MIAFRALTAVACPLPLSNVDTDQLLPARFLKRSRAEGYADALLHDLRFDAEGRPRAEFPLNRPERSEAKILVARRNFGGGSSREAAVYALADHGIRCVVAPSLGDIFASNCVNNGLLPARVSEADGEAILQALEAGLLPLTVDLEAKTVAFGKRIASFEIDPVWRLKLLNGWEDVDLTASYRAEIQAFVEADERRRPWAYLRP